jgi:luciferase-type oxidoreductase
MPGSFERLNEAYNRVFRPGELSIGIFLAIESYTGSIPTMENQVELAQRAEQLGFSALWFRDVPLHVPTFGDVGQIYDPWVYMGYIAAQTHTIALATGSVILPLRHPIHLAKSAATLDQLTHGRMIMGVASGDRPIEYPAFGRNIEERDKLFQSTFQYIRRLTEPFPVIESPLGQMFGDSDLIPKPYGTKVPMIVTGHSGGQPIEWIAQNSDGWLYYPRGVLVQAEMSARWRRTLRDLGLPDKPFAQSFYLDLSSDPDAKTSPIHLGYRTGRNRLIEMMDALRMVGVNHVIYNLKYGRRPANEVLEELGEFLLPRFNRQLMAEMD